MVTTALAWPRRCVMREREAVSTVAAAVPGPELRRFTDASRPEHTGPDLGANVYPDRAAWLAARAEWAAVHGMTVPEWFGAMLAETREAGCTLDELNLAFGRYLTEPDEDRGDPRLPAA
jgi:hypothetical protein